MQMDAAELNRRSARWLWRGNHSDFKGKKDVVLRIVVAARLRTQPGSDQPQSQSTCSCSVFEIGVDVVLIGAPAHRDPCAVNRGSVRL